MKQMRYLTVRQIIALWQSAASGELGTAQTASEVIEAARIYGDDNVLAVLESLGGGDVGTPPGVSPPKIGGSTGDDLKLPDFTTPPTALPPVVQPGTPGGGIGTPPVKTNTSLSAKGCCAWIYTALSQQAAAATPGSDDQKVVWALADAFAAECAAETPGCPASKAMANEVMGRAAEVPYAAASAGSLLAMIQAAEIADKC